MERPCNAQVIPQKAANKSENLGLEFRRLLALGLGWLEATFRGALRPSLHTVLED